MSKGIPAYPPGLLNRMVAGSGSPNAPGSPQNVGDENMESTKKIMSQDFATAKLIMQQTGSNPGKKIFCYYLKSKRPKLNCPKSPSNFKISIYFFQVLVLLDFLQVLIPSRIQVSRLLISWSAEQLPIIR